MDSVTDIADVHEPDYVYGRTTLIKKEYIAVLLQVLLVNHPLGKSKSLAINSRLFITKQEKTEMALELSAYTSTLALTYTKRKIQLIRQAGIMFRVMMPFLNFRNK